MTDEHDNDQLDGIAIVGMACRYPGATSVDAFWRNLCDGVESVTFFSHDELRAAGVPEALLADPSYVRAGTVLDGADTFDAAFFGYIPREAMAMDPQQRVFLETAWHALEDAGYDPERYEGAVGVFAGCAMNTYLATNVLGNREFSESLGHFQSMLANDKDYLTTRVAYKFDLKGPAVTVGTACSTSLVAVHLACQSLLGYQCDMALAGGVAIRTPLVHGYLHADGMIFSPDGHCRPFDADSGGTIGGTGAGVVALKRLADAVADRDRIVAVIRGSAINNDGSTKVGYTAPSVAGQAEAIVTAQAVAGVDAATIGYVEAHGTATRLGDPIEVAALAQAFGAATDRKQFCALGAVKSNMGHADAAAGVGGLIKAALAVRDGLIPPTLHYRAPNPAIDFAESPFFVNTELIKWGGDGAPRRAGVSSFGIGGTNAHAIVEEPPAATESGPSRPFQVLPVSARTATALDAATADLGRFLATGGAASLADVAYTLQVGRKQFEHRRAIVAADPPSSAAALAARRSVATIEGTVEGGETPVVFMFAGVGSQYAGMGAGLYRTERVYAEEIDRGLHVLSSKHGLDLRDFMFPRAGDEASAARALERPSLGIPAVLLSQLAMARLWLSWGVRPHAMIGHSLGDYAAAHIAGVVTFEDALSLAVVRGQLVERVPEGAMLSVPWTEARVRETAWEGVSLAAVNGPESCVVSGAASRIADVERELAATGVEAIRLRTSMPAHSALLDEILPDWERFVRTITLRPPSIRLVSNLTGAWMTGEEAIDPAYWVRHLRETVRFVDGLALVLDEPRAVLLESGPGRTICGIAARHPARTDRHAVVNSMRHARDDQDDLAVALAALGRLWVHGARVDWTRFSGDERRCRVALPLYPFERVRYWVEPDRAKAPAQLSAYDVHQETTMQTAPTVTTPSRKQRILGDLQVALAELSGVSPDALDPDATFLELGFDSLFLTQATQAFHKRFGVKVTFRQLLDDTRTLAALAGHLDSAIPADRFAEPAPAPATVAVPAPLAARHAVTAPTPQTFAVASDASVVERVIAQQLAVMADQIALLRGSAAPVADSATAPAMAGVPTTAPAAPAPEPAATTVGRAAFGPYVPQNRNRDDELTPRQRRALDDLVARYTARTAGSKRQAEENRARFADPRGATGYRQLWKEMVYPIATTRSAGSRMWDVDGNEYLDFTMGFGIDLFGHAPEFVTSAVREQLERGIELGPTPPAAGRLAELLCELTGMERATFGITGTDAIMGAVRAARTVTGRDRIAIFGGGYHGMNDEVLARGVGSGAARRTVPAVPGVPRHTVERVLVLDLDDPECLATLEANAHDLAAVLVEPVQSRRPENRPAELLAAVREITRRAGTALVFDEIVTGFRLHLGGAQAWYGIDADLAVYGKVLSGGVPIAAIAGKAEFMSPFDGGLWSFGDDSAPEADVTFYAGTFNRHPLGLAAALAVLERLKAEGPSLQESLNARGDRLAEAINQALARHGAPIWMSNCGSILQWRFPEEPGFARLFTYYLREKGINIWDRVAFVATVHTDEELARFVAAVDESAREMAEAGFFGVESANEPDEATAPAIAYPVEAPLTEGQAEIWAACQLGDEASCAYNESCTITLRGALDDAALAGAIERVVGRHDALRATIDAAGSRQRMAAPGRVALAREDLSSLDAAARDARVEALLAAETSTPFDLVDGPLYRFTVARLAADRHLIVFTVHHVVCDGSSIGTVLGEIAEVYSALHERRDVRLPAPMQFSEFSRWLERRAASDEQAADERFWLDQFAGPVPVLELPTDRPRPSAKTYPCGVERLTIEADTVAALRKASARQGATLFASLLAAYRTLLFRLSGQEETVVGVPAAGQALVGDDRLVGHCVNLLALKGRSSRSEPFAEALDAERRLVLDAFDHQNLTFGTLVRALRVERDPSRIPLVETVFNLDAEGGGLRFSGLDAEVAGNRRAFTTFDTMMNCALQNGALSVELKYNRDLFDPETIRRWLGHYRSILESATRAIETPLGAIPLMSGVERDRVVHEWNATERPFEASASLVSLFDAQAAKSPDRVAIECGDDRATFAELAARANRLASLLSRMGVGPETPVGVCMARSIDLVVSLLGVLKAGGAYVPLDPAYPADRLSYILEDAGASLLLASGALPSGVRAGSVRVVDVRADASRIAAEPATAPVRGPRPADLAYVIYTSGSTGRPKGVAIEHRSAVALASWAREVYTDDELSGVLASTSVCFDLSVFELFVPLSWGGRVVLVENALALAELRGDAGVRLVNTVPSVMAELVRAGAVPPSVRTVNLAGEPLSTELVDSIYGLGFVEKVYDLYGPTEDTTYSTWTLRRRGERATIGRPISNSYAYVVDEDGEVVPPGIAGELLLGGAGLARGYVRRPDVTAERFVKNPVAGAKGDRVYRTGDVARYLPDGRLEYLGRRDGQVKLRGFRIELGEIEAAIRRCERVEEAVVAVRELVPNDPRIVAWITGGADTASIAAEIARWLPDYMAPSAILALDAMPRTLSGKIDRGALPTPDAARPRAAGPEARAPRTPLEARIAAIWSEVLRIDDVGVDDDFFELGGHSLLATQVVSRLREELGADLGLGVMFAAPTVGELAHRIGAATAQVLERTPSPIAAVSRDAYRIRRTTL